MGGRQREGKMRENLCHWMLIVWFLTWFLVTKKSNGRGREREGGEREERKRERMCVPSPTFVALFLMITCTSLSREAKETRRLEGKRREGKGECVCSLGC